MLLTTHVVTTLRVRSVPTPGSVSPDSRENINIQKHDRLLVFREAFAKFYSSIIGNFDITYTFKTIEVFQATVFKDVENGHLTTEEFIGKVSNALSRGRDFYICLRGVGFSDDAIEHYRLILVLTYGLLLECESDAHAMEFANTADEYSERNRLRG